MSNNYTHFHVVVGDITKLKVDAIVNAANSSLLGGGGVDGAIHRAAGPELVNECRLLGGCKTGQAKLTKGYRLPANFVIHTVGPVWTGGVNNEPLLLAQCYRNSIEIALENDFQVIAFPCISTGIYGFPKQLAAQIAVDTCQKALNQNQASLQIIFCCFDAESHSIYQKIIAQTT